MSGKTKGVGKVTQKYESGRGATVARRPAFTHGVLLREGRQELNMSQQELGDILGKNVSQVSRMESSSDFYPRIGQLVAQLEALGMRLAIQRRDGSFAILPPDEFIQRDGTIRSHGARARITKRRKGTGKKK